MYYKKLNTLFDPPPPPHMHPAGGVGGGGGEEHVNKTTTKYIFCVIPIDKKVKINIEKNSTEYHGAGGRGYRKWRLKKKKFSVPNL